MLAYTLYLRYFELGVVAILLWLLMRCYLKKMVRKYKGYVLLLFLLWLFTVFWVVLLSREEGGMRLVHFIPFESYKQAQPLYAQEILWYNILNVVLFIPGGMFFYDILPQEKARGRITVFFLLTVSILLETCQYFFSLGTAETDDVIYNGFGGIIGVLFVYGQDFLKKNKG